MKSTISICECDLLESIRTPRASELTSLPAPLHYATVSPQNILRKFFLPTFPTTATVFPISNLRNRPANLLPTPIPRTAANMAESAREILKNMSLANRKFSMNRNTGTPRVSTKAQRRFSTHDPSANGMSCSLRVCFLGVGRVVCGLELERVEVLGSLFEGLEIFPVEAE